MAKVNGRSRRRGACARQNDATSVCTMQSKNSLGKTPKRKTGPARRYEESRQILVETSNPINEYRVQIKKV